MKNRIEKYIFWIGIVAALCMGTTYAQTQPSLPAGTQPYSGNIFIAPDGTLWTGKTGNYTALAKKNDIPEIKPSDLGLTATSQVPTMQSLDTWRTGGILFTSLNVANSIAQRDAGGRLSSINGLTGTQVVNKQQLDSVANIATQGFDPMTSGTSVANGFTRSRIMNSHNSSMTVSYIGNPYNNLILSSSDARIVASRTINNTAIIASDKSTLNGGRIQTAIIASTEAEIEAWTSPSTLKWNSAIIASRLGRIQSSNSYTLVTGKLTESNGSSQFVCGQANIREASRSVDDPLKKAFIVGNGVGNENPALNVYSNAFHVTQGGNTWVQNELEVDKAGGGIVLKSPNGNRWRLTVDNSGNLQTEQLN